MWVHVESGGGTSEMVGDVAALGPFPSESVVAALSSR